ncbi:HAD-IB family phosphatase [Spirillospora sp. NPDC029432]|uniref:HAD family hydrolase n=1 Tax=Spirillospora sp. NPDC029432 TaxID=3154599 RepID=UPI0034568109
MGTLHIFDMDGTLLTGSTANLEVARRLGTLPELQALEARFAAGELDTRGFSATLHTLWGHLTTADVTAAYTAGPWLDGIADVCADIRARGEHSAVITMSPDFFARHLLDLGFDDVIASRFPPLPFSAPLDPAGILTPDDKVRLAEELRTRHGLPRTRCVAYGDSMSDAPPLPPPHPHRRRQRRPPPGRHRRRRLPRPRPHRGLPPRPLPATQLTRRPP